MALARIARANLRRSGSAFGNYASEMDLLCEGRSYTSKFSSKSPYYHVNSKAGGNLSYIPYIKEQNLMNLFSLRGISGTPYYQHPSANTERAPEESELEVEQDEPKYAGLEATKLGEKPRVVVLGTGWAACRFLKGLDTRIYDVVCISPRNHMVFTPLLASTCVGTLEFRSVAEPVSRIQKALSKDPNSYFFLASCTGIDTNKHEVYCEAVNNGGLPREPYQFKVAYDKLVIAAGAEPLTFGIQGVKEHAFFLREVNHAQDIRKRLLLNLMLSENPGISEEEKKRLLHCVVIGGGPTGVEFSGELSDFIMRDVHERYTHVKDYVRVTLIEANEILSSFDVSLRQYAIRHLTKSGVHLMKGVVKEVHPKSIVLSDGSVVPYGLLVWSTGVGPSEFVKTLNLPKSPGGRIGVDEWLRVPSVEDVFALGDCAGFLEQTKRPVLPALAQVL
ncbi:Internal alternative NAD(P)H-ubiquinone oxidoreductase A1, mitochondrial [Stylosanthes scabra]|uniref:Internal alternative NAD(P)H-ubiquinone oxidoreductase A1, mitochondrial n=1 Tax=Stylosanthes scabra TaxID=79078 RepID=A0ABU6T8V9_9FABA|nr:Internal alternative NAD(P)H-ubiquinone oxidoreductase A1, mitochondrial [Stylosanthes scabra]